jgi:predicted RNA-binding Zn-ribbon protein involved in translation (DUF1610 family)
MKRIIMPLKITNSKVGADVLLSFAGMIDENIELPDLKEEIAGRVIVDLENLTMINSLGCRNWSKWLKGIKAKQGIVLRHCSPPFISQVNILQNFVPPEVKIESLLVPYYCPNCNHTETTRFEREVASSAPEESPCPSCGGAMEINIDRAKYFHFLGKQSA